MSDIQTTKLDRLLCRLGIHEWKLVGYERITARLNPIMPFARGQLVENYRSRKHECYHCGKERHTL